MISPGKRSAVCVSVSVWCVSLSLCVGGVGSNAMGMRGWSVSGLEDERA